MPYLYDEPNRTIFSIEGPHVDEELKRSKRIEGWTIWAPIEKIGPGVHEAFVKRDYYAASRDTREQALRFFNMHLPKGKEITREEYEDLAKKINLKAV